MIFLLGPMNVTIDLERLAIYVYIGGDFQAPPEDFGNLVRIPWGVVNIIFECYN